MTRYIYEGPVMYFGKCVANNWRGETIANSPKKAKSNLIYQYKTKYGLNTGVGGIDLPGKIKELERVY